MWGLGSLEVRLLEGEGKGQPTSSTSVLMGVCRLEADPSCCGQVAFLSGLLMFGVPLALNGSAALLKRTLGDSDCRSSLRYGGGDIKDVAEGDVAANPGSVPGEKVDSKGQVCILGCADFAVVLARTTDSAILD